MNPYPKPSRRRVLTRSFLCTLLRRESLALLVGALAIAPAVSSASTAAYWRFEDGAFTDDSSGKGNTLASVAAPRPSDQTPGSPHRLPASGAGSAFSKRIPQTGVANGQGLNIGVGAAYAAEDTFNFGSALTVEGFFNADAPDGYLVANWDSSGKKQSWAIGLFKNTETTGQLRIVLNGATGTKSKNMFGIGSVIAGRDYYFAVTYNAGSVTVYLKDLTTSSELETRTWDSGITSLSDVDSQLTVGALTGMDGRGVNPRASFSGLLDEIRLSGTALQPGQLLINLPEHAL